MKINPDTFLGWIDKMANMVKTYGIWTIIKSLFLISISVIVLYCTFNPSAVFNKVTEILSYNHSKAIEYRIQNEPDIRFGLKSLLISTNANRTCILEFHNGTNNMSGLPFLYLDMTYEEVNDVDYVDSDYQNLNMNRFPAIMKIYNDGIWVGSMEELKLFDPRLAARMEANEAKYMGIVLLQGVKSDLGFLVITFKEIPNYDKLTIINTLYKTANKINILLDANNIK